MPFLIISEMDSVIQVKKLFYSFYLSTTFTNSYLIIWKKNQTKQAAIV
jgi:hypothetical protein